jgi:hypothetical protein
MKVNLGFNFFTKWRNFAQSGHRYCPHRKATLNNCPACHASVQVVQCQKPSCRIQSKWTKINWRYMILSKNQVNEFKNVEKITEIVKIILTLMTGVRCSLKVLGEI